jgi:hypothetical protein
MVVTDDIRIFEQCRSLKGITVANGSKAPRDQVGTRLERAQAATRDAEKAKAQYQAEGRAVRERTARLRSLRLAKEAAETAEGVEKKPVSPQRSRRPDR